MSKRLSDTEIWKKAWFFDLPDKYKLFWFYILSDCDAAGVWTANEKITRAFLGEINLLEVQEVFKKQIRVLEGGAYWLIIDFIKFQYGYPIKETAPMYKKISTLLEQRKLKLNTLYNTVYYTVPGTVKDKEEDKGKEEDKEEDRIINPGNIFSDLDDLRMELLNSHSWIDNVAMNSSLTVDQTRVRILDFIKHLKAGNETGKSFSNYQTYFRNWVLKKKEEPQKTGMTLNDWGMMG